MHRRIARFVFVFLLGTLAMVLLDTLPGWELQILASDLSSRILERAREVLAATAALPFTSLEISPPGSASWTRA